MLAGYQHISAGASVRAIESTKVSLDNALVGLVIVILCKTIAGLVGGALGASGVSTRAVGFWRWVRWPGRYRC
jgi:hypothetical protein